MGWLLIVMACKSSEPELPPMPKYDDKKPTFEERFELISPGAKPLAVRRTLGRGRSATRVKLSKLEHLDSDPQPGEMVTAVRDFDVELRGTEASVTLDACEEHGKTNTPCDFDYKGKRWQLQLTPRGSIKAFTDVPADRMSSGYGAAKRADIERAFASLFPPVPTEPIGLGAKWRTRNKDTTSGGGDVTTDTTYELTAITDDALTIAFTAEIKRNVPAWHIVNDAEKLEKLDARTGKLRGAVTVAIDGMSPARAVATERLTAMWQDQPLTAWGHVEAKPDRQELELPLMAVTCDQLAACCALADEQTCKDLEEPAACAKQFLFLQRGMFIAGTVPAACL